MLLILPVFFGDTVEKMRNEVRIKGTAAPQRAADSKARWTGDTYQCENSPWFTFFLLQGPSTLGKKQPIAIITSTSEQICVHMYPLFVALRRLRLFLPAPCQSEHIWLPADVLAVSSVTAKKKSYRFV